MVLTACWSGGDTLRKGVEQRAHRQGLSVPREHGRWSLGSGFCRLGFSPHWLPSVTLNCSKEHWALSSHLKGGLYRLLPSALTVMDNEILASLTMEKGEDLSKADQKWSSLSLHTAHPITGMNTSHHLHPAGRWGMPPEITDAVSAPWAVAQESFKFFGTKLQTDIRSHKSVLDSGPFPPSQLCCAVLSESESVKVLVTQLCPTLCYPIDYTACQAPLFMKFFRQEYWSG